MTLENFAKYAGYAVTAIGALYTVFTVIRKHYYKRVKPFFENVAHISSTVTKMDTKIDDMDGRLMMLTKMYNSTLYLDPNPIFKADAKGACTFVNYAWLRITGFSGQEEAMGGGWLKAVYQPDKELVWQEWMQTIELQGQFDLQYRYVNRQTQEITLVHCRTTAIKDYNKNIIQIIGLVEILS